MVREVSLGVGSDLLEVGGVEDEVIEGEVGVEGKVRVKVHGGVVEESLVHNASQRGQSARVVLARTLQNLTVRLGLVSGVVKR